MSYTARRHSARYVAQAQEDTQLAHFYANRSEQAAALAQYYAGQAPPTDVAGLEGGVARAKANLGVNYYDGQAPPIDIAGLEGGVARAKANLGVNYYDGQAITKPPYTVEDLERHRQLDLEARWKAARRKELENILSQFEYMRRFHFTPEFSRNQHTEMYDAYHQRAKDFRMKYNMDWETFQDLQSKYVAERLEDEAREKWSDVELDRWRESKYGWLRNIENPRIAH
jgi:hypothetical protein